ncbi:MAG: DUF2182 domain-containing protein, partial [Pseudonocardia sp.]|nr:DUF2182 domain-containing protein [Pseudonocardia sp.]
MSTRQPGRVHDQPPAEHTTTVLPEARLRDPGTALWTIAGVAWLALVGWALLAPPDLAGHHSVAEAVHTGSRQLLLVLASFAAAWLVMVAAMMLPTTVPMIRMFHTVTANQPSSLVLRSLFQAAYIAIWSGFAAVALVGDLGVHTLVRGWPWLGPHDGQVGGGGGGLGRAGGGDTRR